MKPKRILMTADAVGGVWTYAMELARALRPQGVEVALAVMGPEPSRAQRAEAARISNLDLFKSNYKLEWMPDCWAEVRRAGDWLLHLEQRLQPEVVHLNGYTHGALEFAAPKIVVAHSCVLSWWKSVRRDSISIEWRKYQSAVEAGLRNADLVIAPTRAMLRALQHNYTVQIGGRVIPNGLDATRFISNEKQRFILSAGRLWDEAKNVQALIDIARTLPWSVCIAGETGDPDQHSTPAQTPNCYLLGNLAADTLLSWYSCAAVYALPALYEPFGLTVLEAALSGCALVVGDIDSLNENWSDAALFVDPRDPQELRETLLRLIRDEELRGKMADRARLRALQFTSERMAHQYLGAYCEAMAMRGIQEAPVCA